MATLNQDAGTASTEPAVGGRLVILVVDDDPFILDALAFVCPELFGSDHVVRQATTVEGAVPLFRDNPDAHVILVDGYIPRLPTDGLDVMRRLRDAGYAGPIVAISSGKSIRERMVLADPTGFTAACDKLDRRIGQVIRDLIARSPRRSGGAQTSN